MDEKTDHTNTPTRDEAVQPLGYMRPADKDGNSFWCSRQKSAYYTDPVFASAPAPASGGVHAVREALLGYVLKPGQYETASVFARGQNRVAVDMLGVLDEASLSPAATPVSEAEPVAWRWRNADGPWHVSLVNPHEGRYDKLEHRPLYEALANPASSPAGGDVVQTLIDKTEKLIEAADDMGWSCNSSSADQAIREAKDAVRAALSQSTSAGKVGE